MNYCSTCCFNAVSEAGGVCGSCRARAENSVSLGEVIPLVNPRPAVIADGNQPPVQRTMMIVDESPGVGPDIFANAKCWSSKVVSMGAVRGTWMANGWTTRTKNAWGTVGTVTLEGQVREAVLAGIASSTSDSLVESVTRAVMDVVGRPTGMVNVPGKSEAELPDFAHYRKATHDAIMAVCDRVTSLPADHLHQKDVSPLPASDGPDFRQVLDNLRAEQEFLGTVLPPKPPVEPETADHRPYLRELSREEREYLRLMNIRMDKHPFVDRVAAYCRMAGLSQHDIPSSNREEWVVSMHHYWGFMTDHQRQLCRKAVWKYEYTCWPVGRHTVRDIIEASRDKSDRLPGNPPSPGVDSPHIVE